MPFWVESQCRICNPLNPDHQFVGFNFPQVGPSAWKCSTLLRSARATLYTTDRAPKGFKRRLRHKSYFSPKFAAAGPETPASRHAMEWKLLNSGGSIRGKRSSLQGESKTNPPLALLVPHVLARLQRSAAGASISGNAGKIADLLCVASSADGRR